MACSVEAILELATGEHKFGCFRLSVRSARAADVAESHLFRHSDSYLYSGAALS
jgi:hypothetical protein